MKTNEEWQLADDVGRRWRGGTEKGELTRREESRAMSLPGGSRLIPNRIDLSADVGDLGSRHCDRSVETDHETAPLARLSAPS